MSTVTFVRRCQLKSNSTFGRKSLNRRPPIRWRNLRFELLEDRRLLALSDGSDEAGMTLQLVGGPQGLIDLGRGEMALLATGPAPSELRFRISDNLNAADTTNTDQIQSGGSLGLNLTGQGYTVGVWDGGLIRSSHQEFDSRVTNVDSGSEEDHATHVAGTIGAKGVFPLAKGMAPQVNLRSRNWTNDFTEMDADADLIDVSNHSYGYVAGWSVRTASTFGFSTPTGLVNVWWEDRFTYSTEAVAFGKYDSSTRNLDQVLVNHRALLSVWSAGNDRNDAFTNASGNGTYVAWFSGDPGGIGWSGAGWYLVPNAGATAAPASDGNSGTGYDSLSLTHNAKNSLVVGAVNDITSDPYTPGQIIATSFSSYGPTDDGRVKPDVVGNGLSLLSPVATSNTAYGISSGTSMSSPNVAGTAVLLVEHFANEFGTTPLSASTKGLLIHTASDAGNTGPDYAYGWGLVNAAAAATFISDAATAGTSAYLEERDYFGSVSTIEAASDGTQPLKVTIVWTDPAPAVLPGPELDDAKPTLVNDLDLWITGPGGTYYPWTLEPLNPSAAAVRTKGNHVDNVEQVLIDAPASGAYTVHVGRAGPLFTQAYTLLLSGATVETPTPAASLSLAGSPISEASGVATVTAMLSEKSRLPVIVNLAFSGSANLSEYLRSQTSITVPPGKLDASMTLTAQPDALHEANETIIVDIDGVINGVEIGTQQVTAVIADDDSPKVTLNLSGSPMTESGGAVAVSAVLSAAAGVPVTVDLAFSGTATLTADYVPTASRITIATGQTSGEITLTATPDSLDESDETVVVDINSVSNGTEDGTQRVTATITDDDPPPTVKLVLTGSPMDEDEGESTVTAMLSTVSGLPVTVNLMFSGTAIFTEDYTRSATSITIPAGSMTGSITLTAVQDTVDKSDETIVVDIDTVTNGTETGTQRVTAVIADDDLLRFFVVDNVVDDMFGYSADGNNRSRSNLVSGATDPRGVTTTADGSTFWILNGNKVIDVVDAEGQSLGSWSAAQLRQPTGIATDGTDIWIVDKGTDTVYRFNGAASVTTGSLTTSSSFKLARTNAAPEGLATDGTKIWVVNSGSPDRVFLYSMPGKSLGNWSIDSTNVSPTGITIDPTGASQSIWIVDISKDRVFEYPDARSWTSGTRKASSSFALASGNTSPQDIVDPDVSLRSLTAKMSAGGDRDPVISSDAEASSSAAAVWDPYGLASPTLAGMRLSDSLPSNSGGTVLQPRSAMVQRHARTGVRAALDQADAGPGLAIDKSRRTADEAWEDLLAVLAGRSRSDWLVAADGLFSTID